MRAEIKPIIVMGATAGAASKFAITLIGAKYPAIAIKTGEQKRVAAIGGAKASLINFGKYLESHAIMRGAKSSKPAVAKTDKAKPASRACHGSPITTAAIAKPRSLVNSQQSVKLQTNCPSLPKRLTPNCKQFT